MLPIISSLNYTTTGPPSQNSPGNQRLRDRDAHVSTANGTEDAKEEGAKTEEIATPDTEAVKVEGTEETSEEKSTEKGDEPAETDPKENPVEDSGDKEDSQNENENTEDDDDKEKEKFQLTKTQKRKIAKFMSDLK